jgi:hypothetical protein
LLVGYFTSFIAERVFVILVLAIRARHLAGIEPKLIQLGKKMAP